MALPKGWSFRFHWRPPHSDPPGGDDPWGPDPGGIDPIIGDPGEIIPATCTQADPNDEEPDDDALNACIAGGGQVVLTYGYPGYIIATGLHISRDDVVIRGDGGWRPRLLADPWLDAPMLEAHDMQGYQIRDVIFNGDRLNRVLYTNCLDSVNARDLRNRGFNLILKGRGHQQ